MALTDAQLRAIRETYPAGALPSGDQTPEQAMNLAVKSLGHGFLIEGLDPEPAEAELRAELGRLAARPPSATADPVVRDAPPERVAYVAGQVSDEWVDAGRAAELEDPASGDQFWMEVRDRLLEHPDWTVGQGGSD